MYLCGECVDKLDKEGKEYTYIRAVPYASTCDECGDYESIVHEIIIHKGE